MKNESGRSMVEMLGVLAIIGVLSAGALAGYSKAMYKIKMNKMIEQLSKIAVNVQIMASNDTSHTITDEWLYDHRLTAGFIPEEMIQGDKILTPFQNELYLLHGWGDATRLEMGFFNGHGIAITSPQMCADLSAVNWGNLDTAAMGIFSDSEYIESWIGDDYSEGYFDEDVYIATKYGTQLRFPVSASVYAPVCKKCTEQNPCNFQLIFEL